MIKFCATCKQGKELDEFNNDKTRKDGKYPVCRKCRKRDSPEILRKAAEYLDRFKK